MQLLRLILLTFASVALSFAADDITGKWTGELTTQDGTMKLTMDLKAEGETFTGTVGTHMGEMPIKEGKIKGDELSWFTTLERDGNVIKILNKAKVSGPEMKVTISVEGRDITMEFTAKKAS
jgi:hypothetical protein